MGQLLTLTLDLWLKGENAYYEMNKKLMYPSETCSSIWPEVWDTTYIINAWLNLEHQKFVVIVIEFQAKIVMAMNDWCMSYNELTQHSLEIQLI